MEQTFHLWLLPCCGMGGDTDSGEELVTFWQKSTNKHSLPIEMQVLALIQWPSDSSSSAES